MDHRPVDLVRALSAIRRTQERWLTDLAGVCVGDPRFHDAFRRWQEQLSLLRLQLLRAEGRLLHYLMVPDERRPRGRVPGPSLDRPARYGHWQGRISDYLLALHLDTRYRRLVDPLDLTAEAVTADVVTDLVALAVLAEETGAALSELPDLGPVDHLEDLAFFRVLSPWRIRGLGHLHDVLRWLDGFLVEHSEL